MSSMLERKILPSGSKVFIGEEVQKKRDIEEQIRGIFSLWGFQEIITPSFEFYAPDKESDSRDSEIFKTVDLETGNLLSLRSDVTPQIAQIAGTVLESAPRPLRFSYVTKVFRYMNVYFYLEYKLTLILTWHIRLNFCVFLNDQYPNLR